MEPMNEKSLIRISYWQVFLLTVAQAGGASILYLPGALEAGRDVWLSNILASIMGYIVIYLHYKPLSLSKSTSMTITLNQYWGRFIGGIANLYYLYFFFILSNLIASDVFYFGKITMPETPGYVFVIFLLVPAVYAVKLGIETISRFLEFLLPLLVIIFCILFIFLLPKLELRNLLPIASNGIKPILAGTIPNISFPFADLLPIVFFYQYTRKDTEDNSKFLKTTFSAILLITLLLTLRAMATVASFEEMTLKTLTFPPFNAIRIIKIGDVLERLDALFLAVFYTTTFFKFTITYYVICKIITDFFNISGPKIVAVPMAVLIGVSMPFLFPSFDTVLKGSISSFYLVIPLLLLMPIILYITIKVKGKGDQENEG